MSRIIKSDRSVRMSGWEGHGTVYDSVKPYLDSDTGTLTVDPVGRERWIYEGGGGRHQQGVNDSRQKEADIVNSLRPLLQPPELVIKPFIPSESDLEYTHRRYPNESRYEHGAVAPFDQHYSYRNNIITDARIGSRGIIDQMHRDGTLPQGVSKDAIQQQINASERRVMDRVFER